MDTILWNFGRAVASNRGHVKAWELDFLRGMHQRPALKLLAEYLQATTRQDVRLLSIWMDKHAWVSWTGSSGSTITRRELADLAVVVRRRENQGIARWMWLLQGKRTNKLLDTYTGTSAKHEIDLLQRMPEFSLAGVATPFNLSNEFPPTGSPIPSDSWRAPVAVPWTFLDFDANRFAAQSSYLAGYSPVAPRWLGEPAFAGTWGEQWQNHGGYPTFSISSYVQCLISIVEGHARTWHDAGCSGKVPPRLAPGAPVGDTKFPEWSRLYCALLKMASTSTIGHAITSANPKGSVLQISKFAQNRMLRICNRSPFRRSGVISDEVAWAVSSKDGSQQMRAIEQFNTLADVETDFEDFEEAVDIQIPDGSNQQPSGMQVLFVDILGEDQVIA